MAKEYFQIRDWARSVPGLKPSERLLLVLLAQRYPEIRPSVTTLAVESCLGRRQVQNLLRMLEEKGIIKVKLGTGAGHTNLYELNAEIISKSSSHREKEPNPNGKFASAARRQQPKPKKIPFPNAFAPSREDIEYAQERGIRDVDSEVEKCRKWHHSKNVLIEDPADTFHNWCTNHRPQSRRPENNQVHNGSVLDYVKLQLRELEETDEEDFGHA